VREVESLVIGQNQNPVWTLRIVDDAGQLSSCIDPIHSLLVLFHPFAVAVARVGEIDIAAAVEVEIVRTIAFLSVVAVGACDDLLYRGPIRDDLRLGLRRHPTRKPCSQDTYEQRNAKHYLKDSQSSV